MSQLQGMGLSNAPMASAAQPAAQVLAAPSTPMMVRPQGLATLSEAGGERSILGRGALGVDRASLRELKEKAGLMQTESLPRAQLFPNGPGMTPEAEALRKQKMDLAAATTPVVVTATDTGTASPRVGRAPVGAPEGAPSKKRRPSEVL